MAYFVGWIANTLPLPGGIGGVEGGMIGAFTAFGVGVQAAVVAVLAYRAFSFWLPTLPGGGRLLPAAPHRPRLGDTPTPPRADGDCRRPPESPQAAAVPILSEVTENAYENVVIVGSGPAGYTAALYTARANLNPLVIEGFAWGGLLQQTTDVENYPGFPQGIMGPELMQQMRDQAERFGARLETDEATAVELSPDGGLHKVYVGDDVHLTRSVILAMGAQHRKLGGPRRGAALRPRRQLLRDLRCGVLPRRADRDRRRRRLGDGGGDVPLQVRLQGRDHPPPRRVPRLEHHARARSRRSRTSSF